MAAAVNKNKTLINVSCREINFHTFRGAEGNVRSKGEEEIVALP